MTPWDPLQRGYFSADALWTYLDHPLPDGIARILDREIDPVEDNGETWAGLQVRFPAEIASHSSMQEFYFGEDHLLRRHDYRVDVAGGFSAIQYVYDIVSTDGIKVPSKRRAYRRDSRPGGSCPMN